MHICYIQTYINLEFYILLYLSMCEGFREYFHASTQSMLKLFSITAFQGSRLRCMLIAHKDIIYWWTSAVLYLRTES